MAKRILIVQQPGKGFFEQGKLKSILKKGGYEVVGDTSSHAESLQLVRRHKPDLVVFEPYPFDEDEEYHSNLSLLKNIRLENNLKPVIMCGKREDHVGQKFSAVDVYLGRGAADFIFQPYKPDDVYRRIERLFSVPKTDMTIGREMWVMVQQFDHSDRTWIHHLLWENGYDVELSCNCFECLEVCREAVKNRNAEPDLLIAEDIETLAEFQKEYPDVAVMMCCSNSRLEFIEGCIVAGTQDLLLKPFEIKEFWRRVHSCCQNSKNSRLRRQAQEQEQAKEKAIAQEAGKVILLISPTPLTKLPSEIRKALDENGYMIVYLFERAPYTWDYQTIYQREKPNLVLLNKMNPAILEDLKKADPSMPMLVFRYPEQKATEEEFLALGAADCWTLSLNLDSKTFMRQVECLRRWPVPAQPEKVEAPVPSPSPEPEDIQTPYSQKIAKMTPDELLAELQRVASRKVSDIIARVLVIQKAELMQAAIRKMLEETHFQVVGTASEGWRCLELYREKKPDVVILDTVLANDTDGIIILQLLQKENPPAKVLMTSPSEESVINECVRSGAKGILCKPFKLEDLRKKVLDILR